MVAGSSSNSHVLDVGEEYPYPSHVCASKVGEKYPYPSHVCAPNFITVKLSDRNMYDLWSTQMQCLLEGHDVLDFIYTSPAQTGKQKVDDNKLWRRTDALIKGWILGSLSEHALQHVIINLKTKKDSTAKDVWDKVQNFYGPAPPLVQQPAPPLVQQPAYLAEESIKQYEDAKLINDEEKRKEKKKEEEKERAKLQQDLYEATLSQDLEAVKKVLKENIVTLTDKITINGNTALHVAVGTTKKTEFLRSMLKLAKETNSELDMKNSEGSTLLHVAAIVGNLDAAKMLLEKGRNLLDANKVAAIAGNLDATQMSLLDAKNQNLLNAKDNEGQTPLGRALSNMHTATYLYLLRCSSFNAIDNMNGEELVVNAITSKDYRSALELIVYHKTIHSDAILMAIAQSISSWPKDTYLERFMRPGMILVDRIEEAKHDISISDVKEDPYISCMGTIFFLIFGVFIGIYMLLWYILKTLLVKHRVKVIKSNTYHSHYIADALLRKVCYYIRKSKDPRSQHLYYTNPILEATRQNAHGFVVRIVSFFPNAIWSINEDGHNIIQIAVINRSEKVYNLLYQMSEHKNVYRTIKDRFGNNLLHLAARLAPHEKLHHISGAALQLQRELQWFKEVEKFVCLLNIIQKNSFGETPQMVFTREHKELVIEGEKWMKVTAESYAITATLITTVVFAAAITVPGGNNQDTGFPIFTNDTAFTIFAISDAISLFTAITSFLLFLSILTTRYAEQDFLLKLPTKLVIGLLSLFMSTTAMIVAFGATLFLVFAQKKPWILIPIAALTCLPIISFVTLQFPLIVDLVNSTYGRSIFGKKSERPFY